MSLPMDAAKRKTIPLATGCIDYFPDALAAVADLSRVGGEQHNPGMPLFWDKSKSTDHGDALMRHFIERGTFDVDGVRHSAKVAWRALALLQVELENADVKAAVDKQYEANLARALKHIGKLSGSAIASHPMHAESLREEYNKADGETGV